MKASKPWTRRCRFKLRTLMLLMAAASVAFGLYMRSVRRQQEAVAAVKRLGGHINYDYQRVNGENEFSMRWLIPKRLLQRLGDDYFQDVVAVTFAEPSPVAKVQQNAGELPWLEGLPDLEQLYLLTVKPNDNDLERIGRMRRLRVLYIGDGSRVTDRGICHLGRLSRLERLAMETSNLSDQSLAAFSPLSNLSELYLGQNQITSAGLVHLQGLARLEQLDLGQTRVDNAGLKRLVALTNLQGLNLEGSRVTDASELRRALPKCRVTGAP